MRELSLHILDLVQNSLEAGATEVVLEIIEDRHTMDSFMIRVTDNGRGMDEEICNNVIDPFVTTRTKRRVGLGLSLMDMSTKRCNGYLTVTSAPGCGTAVEGFYQHSHLDRAPLGNIVDTIKSIIVANPKLHFSYCHTVDQAVFSLATQELIGILGDVPLTQPDVLVWLNEYLTINEDNLYNETILHGGVSFENN